MPLAGTDCRHQHSVVPRVAIDIPSGLNGLTGIPQPVAVRADLTVTFIGRKSGQFLADGPDYCGELVSRIWVFPGTSGWQQPAAGAQVIA